VICLCWCVAIAPCLGPGIVVQRLILDFRNLGFFHHHTLSEEFVPIFEISHHGSLGRMLRRLLVFELNLARSMGPAVIKRVHATEGKGGFTCPQDVTNSWLPTRCGHHICGNSSVQLYKTVQDSSRYHSTCYCTCQVKPPTCRCSLSEDSIPWLRTERWNSYQLRREAS
jgi:hypothetical protein